MEIKRFSYGLIGCLLSGLVSGCATTLFPFPTEPLESFNRGVDQFNRDFDKTLSKPVAKGYRKVTPDPVDRGVSNFFGNIADINSVVNNVLQLKPKRALSDVGRVCINTTVGMLGMFDVASEAGLPSYKEDMGQTLGYWGVGETPYLVIPLLGPSTLRDFTGQLADTLINPVYVSSQTVAWALSTLRFIDVRADLLETSDILEEAAVDPYAFVRETYLQIRRAEISDGELPMDQLLFEDEIRFEDE